jgi:uncharacterized protein (UPF0147 family)
MNSILEEIRDVLEDADIPKATRTKLEEIVSILEGPGEPRLKANRALCELEELSYNTTLPAFIRAQLWNISSMLETV